MVGRLQPNGEILVSGGEDGTIRLWNVQTGEQLKTLQPERPYERTNISGITGLTDAQKASLQALGAVEDATSHSTQTAPRSRGLSRLRRNRQR